MIPLDGAIGHDGAIPAVALLSASWAGPSRPAPTVLRELARRWGPTVHTLLLEDPSEEVLEQWGVEVLPTWVRLLRADALAGPTGIGPASTGPASTEPAGADPADSEPEGSGPAGSSVEDGLSFSDYSGVGPHGEPVLLPGQWRVVRRRTGAQPKHVIEDEFGPGA